MIKFWFLSFYYGPYKKAQGAVNPKKSSAKPHGLDRVDRHPMTRGRVCCLDCLLFTLHALWSSCLKKRSTLAALQGNGFICSTGRFSPSPISSSPLSSLDINSLTTFFHKSLQVSVNEAVFSNKLFETPISVKQNHILINLTHRILSF